MTLKSRVEYFQNFSAYIIQARADLKSYFNDNSFIIKIIKIISVLICKINTKLKYLSKNLLQFTVASEISMAQ